MLPPAHSATNLCMIEHPTKPSHGCYTHAQVASYMRAVLRTLSQCHHHKILHRDIKPGRAERLKVMESLMCSGVPDLSDGP